MAETPLSPQAAADIYAGAARLPGRRHAARCMLLVLRALGPCTRRRPSAHALPAGAAVCPTGAGQLDPVGFDTLREAQRISRFAVAAYGLQGVIWAKGQ